MKKLLKIVSISHSAFTEGHSRLRYERLTDIDLTLVVPAKWKEDGREWAADPSSSSLDIRLRSIRLAKCGKAKWYMHYYPGLGALLNDLRPDVVDLWEEPWSIVALQAVRLACRQSHRPALILESEQNILRRLPFPFEQIRRYTLQHTDALIVRQPEALEVCRSCGYTGPGVVVEYCVDPKIFYPNDRAGAKTEFGATGFTIGYAGRLVPGKGLLMVLEALHLCKQNVRFLILGDGPEKDVLANRISELGLEHRVRFVPPVTQDRVARFMNALDVFVLMSQTTRTWKEQFGRVIMEAQACGVPVIGSDSGSIPSVIGDGGWIVKESDAVGLSQVLDRLAANPNEIIEAGARGIAQATSRFSPNKVASDFREAFVLSLKSQADRQRATAYMTEASRG